MTLCATVEDIGLVHAEIWPRLTESQVSQIVGIIEKKNRFSSYRRLAVSNGHLDGRILKMVIGKRENR